MSSSDIEGAPSTAAILAVDDVPANLLALSAILEPLRERVVTATSGREALAAAAREAFAVILLDVRLPDMDGFETLARLRGLPRNRQTPVILLTAYDLSADAMDHVQELGLVDYILKPIAPALLRSKVIALVALYRRGEQIRRRDEALAAKDRGIAMLAHDLQSPLAVVAMSAGRLVRQDLDPSARKTADRIVRGVARMSDMVHNLTDYARAGQGPIPITRAVIDLGDVCRDLTGELGQLDPARRIDLGCEGNLVGEWDQTRLHQALSNLVRNALKYGTGDVVVRARDAGDRVEITVHNDGPPIPPERLPIIFGAFERGQQEGAGLGLGLYIVREIAKAHAGAVEVTSSAERGTTFVLRLPRRVDQASPAP
ncbi:MAG TPA: hybrid sensor histidine kinase/response regulator [Polyangia bacterium]|jgi:signal transduction histidine kinase